MSWFGCKHEWYPVAVMHYRDTSYTTSGTPSSTVTSRCLKCGEIKSDNMYGVGYLVLEDLQRAPVRFPQPYNKPNLKLLK